MKQIQWIAAVVVTATMGFVGTARAAMYAYARQQTTAYAFTGGTLGTAFNGASSSASNDLGGTSHNGGGGAVQQSFVGFGPAPAENTFTQASAFLDDFSRGDAQVELATVGTDNVAESRLAGLVTSAAAGSWMSTTPFTIASSQAVTLSFSYLNQITLGHDGTGGGLSSAQAGYTFNFSVKNSAGAIVFSSSPNALNLSAGLTTAGTFNQPGSGSVAITTSTLPAGTYSMTLSGTETVFVNNNAGVPEPASLGILGAFGSLALRRRRR